MTVLASIAALRIAVDAAITTNGSGAITGAVHNTIENDLIDTLESFLTSPAASTTVSGIQENATTAEVNTGTSTTRTITPDSLTGSAPVIAATNFTGVPCEIGISLGAEDGDLAVATSVVTFRMPYAMTLTSVRANVVTAPTGSVATFDINETGSTILSTKITIDATEKTSQTAATAPVISDSALADDAEMTIDVDVIGSTIAGAGGKIWLIGTRA